MTNSSTFKAVGAFLTRSLSLGHCKTTQTTARYAATRQLTISNVNLSMLLNWARFPQVVMAAAAAAGLNRNGIRRTAFSTGDLQALSVLPNKNSPSPPDPANANLHRYTSSCQSAAKPVNHSTPHGSADVFCCMTVACCCCVLLCMTGCCSPR